MGLPRLTGRPRRLGLVVGLAVLLVAALVAQAVADRPKETFAAVVLVVALAVVGLLVRLRHRTAAHGE